MRFYRCFFTGMDEAGVYIANTNGQSKSHTFLDCSFSSSKHGIRTRSGSFQIYSSTFGQLDTAIRLGIPTDNILIMDVDSEGCRQFLSTDGGTNGYWPISIIGGRFSIKYCVPGLPYINYTDGGPLLITGALFESYTEPSAIDFKIKASTPSPGSMLVAIGNGFPNDAPFDVGTMHGRVVALGNRGYSGSSPMHLADQFSNYLGAEGRFMIGELSGDGSGYVCVDGDGTLYRSVSPCTVAGESVLDD